MSNYIFQIRSTFVFCANKKSASTEMEKILFNLKLANYIALASSCHQYLREISFYWKIKQLICLTESVFCIDVQPKTEKPLVASGGEDDICYIWDLESGEVKQKLTDFKGQIISECPYEIIVSPKIPTKKIPRFLP